MRGGAYPHPSPGRHCVVVVEMLHTYTLVMRLLHLLLLVIHTHQLCTYVLGGGKFRTAGSGPEGKRVLSGLLKSEGLSIVDII